MAVAALAPAHAADEAIAWTQLAVAIGLVYALALKPGAIGLNPYGPDPRPVPAPQSA